MAYARQLFVALILTIALASAQQCLAQSNDVRNVQDRLTILGYNPGPVDGVVGPKTRAALKSFQAHQGLPVTGEADERTLSALGVSSTTTSNDILPAVLAPRSQNLLPVPPLDTSQPQAPTTELSTSDNGSARAPKATNESPRRTSDATETKGGSKMWWVGAIGLGLFLLWRRRRRKTATTPTGSDHETDVDLGALRIRVERSRDSSSVSKRRSTPQDGKDFWVPAGKSARVAGHEIGGMVYVGRGLHAVRSGRAENCLIDPSLPLAKRTPDIMGERMPYWPSYSELHPSSRLAYLHWLSSGRTDPNIGVGYVFLYFYGLERRLFLDYSGEHERSALISEVQRLRKIFGGNRSFDRYSLTFLDAAAILSGTESSPVADPESLIAHSHWELPLRLKIALGYQIRAGQPLNGEWLLCWWLAHPETRLRVPAKRAFPEFKSLFLMRFAEQYPDGFRVTTPRRPLTFTYRSASGTFERDFRRELAGYPDISRLTMPVNVAAGIAERCMNDLDAYSRYLGRKPDGRGSIEAHALLPEELAAQMPSAELEALREWVDERIAESHGVVPVEAVLECLEGESPARVGRRALASAADALARISIGLAPDPRFAVRSPRAGEPVMLFRLPREIAKLEDVSSDYTGALLSIVLGTYVAHADGTVSSVERQRLKTQIDRMTSLSDSERARLHANLTWMAVVPPKLSQLRKHFDAVTEDQKHAIGQLAIAVAGADGVIDPAEVNAVQKLYRAMGLPDEQVFGDLHRMAAAPSSEPVTIFKAGVQPKGFTIPEPVGQARVPTNGPLRLDHERISAIMADTHRASKVLSEIFADDAAEDETTLEYPDQDGAGLPASDGLDGPHRALVEELVTRPSWSAADINQLASQFGLLSEGAIETVNEWAFEQFDDALLEADDDYMVNQGIVEALQNETRRTSDDATRH